MTSFCKLSGEAAGLALGLVMLGSKSAQAIEDMVSYAQETQHEKILRGLAVGIALVMYGRMEEADALIESLCRDKVSWKSHHKLTASIVESETAYFLGLQTFFCDIDEAYEYISKMPVK